MAIAIRGGSPLVAATTSNPVSGTLTGSQQPQAGDLLVIIHGNDFFDLSNMVTPTVGGSTTGVNAVTNGVADAGSNLAHVKAYTYVVGSTGDLTVAATETGTDGEEKMLVVYVLSGADTTTPIDGGSAGAAGSFSLTGGSSLVLTGVTPSGSDAFLIAHLNTGGGSSAGPPYTPPGAPFTELYDSSTGGIAYTGGAEQLSASGATGTRTFTSAGSGSWAGVLIAVKTAASSPSVAAATPPLPPHLLYMLAARNQRQWTAGPSAGGTVNIDGNLTVTATAAGTATVDRPTSTSLTATGTITAAAGLTLTADASLTATATLTASTTLTRGAATTLTGTATITAAADVVPAGLSADATLTATGTVTAAVAVGRAAAAAVTETAAITAAAAVARAAAATLTATATVTATAAVARPTSASVSAAAGITPTAQTSCGAGVTRSVTATITADAVIGVLPIGAAATLTATATVTVIAKAVVIRPNTGTITRPDTGTITRPNTGIISRP